MNNARWIISKDLLYNTVPRSNDFILYSVTQFRNTVVCEQFVSQAESFGKIFTHLQTLYQVMNMTITIFPMWM